ncbi:hypothetical protein VP01_5840g1 [Puccinia sorghi]|uniref:Uncharacterized protein n=1 Tax=Puccinia sorghi TaxID=27349 RepID=A0A0L6UIT4_9BASI|nr:hypothetical protein VP01_5840g1 [Puccinia sorghi]
MFYLLLLRLKTFTVDLKTNTKLINYYLTLIKIHHKYFIKNYQPTHWENLTQDEQKRIIEQKLLDRQEEILKARLEINKFFCLHRKFCPTPAFFLVSTINTSTVVPNTTNLVPNAEFTTEEYNPKTNQTDNEDFIDWGKCPQPEPNTPNLHKHSRQPPKPKNSLAKVTKVVESPTDLATRVQQMNFKRIEQVETTSSDSIELDNPPPSLDAAQKPPTPLEDKESLPSHQQELKRQEAIQYLRKDARQQPRQVGQSSGDSLSSERPTPCQI